MTNTFIESIKARLRVFGMDLQNSEAHAELDGFYTLHLWDIVHHVTYVGFAVAKVDEAMSWANVLDDMLATVLDAMHTENAELQANYPVIMVVPTEQAEVLHDEATTRGAYPITYRLLDKYSIVGFSVADSEAMHSYMSKNAKHVADADLSSRIAPASKGKKRILAALVVAALLMVAVFTLTPYVKSHFLAEPESASEAEPLAEPEYEDPYWAVDSPDASAREAVAGYPNIPDSYIRTLAEDTDEGVRAAVAGNASVPEDVLDKLSQDVSARVRDSAVSNPVATSTIRNRVYPDLSLAPCDVRERISAGASVSPEMLIAAGQGGDVCAKRGVAQNSKTPSKVLSRLVQDADALVHAHAVDSIVPYISETALVDFATNVDTLVSNIDFQQELHQAGASWKDALRKRLNGEFRQYIYDPTKIEAVENPVSFEKFVSDMPDLADYEMEIAKTADKIVLNAMTAVTPYLERVLDSGSIEQEAPETFFDAQFMQNGTQQLNALRR
jgi:hypothetical protein